MEFLSMSRDEVQRHVASSGFPRVDKMTVGAAILRHDNSGPSILLLKRNPGEKYYPNVFEIPGGKVDATDSTIREAVVREVVEETGLTVLDVTSPLSSMTYATEKLERTPTGENEIVKHHALQISYVVTVEGTDFRVNEEEHSTGAWVTREALDQLPITSQMRSLVFEALNSETDRSSAQKIDTPNEKVGLWL